jgi:Flp pilus assembly protein TadD
MSQQVAEAEAALEQQDYKTAEAKLKVLAAADPQDGRVLYDLGFAEERNGEDADAAKAYAGSAAAIPGFAEPRVALGLLDARSGRAEAAHKELLEAANLETAAPELRARALRALAHLDESSQPGAAREELLAALKLTGETAGDVLMGAELAERAGDPADAEPAYRRALKLMPDDVDAISGLAHVLQQEGKLPEADAVVSDGLKAHPGDARLVAQAVSLYAAEGKESKAIPMLEQLRASDPKIAADAGTTRLLAQLYYVSGDNAGAEKLYAGLVAAEPDDPTLLDALGSAQVKLGQDAAAEATLSRAVAMRAAFHDDKAWGEAAAHLAFAASKNNDPKMCLQALAARATVLPNSPTSLFLEATAYDNLRQNKEAARAYRAFLAVADGKFPDQEFQARHRLVALEPK